MGVGIETSSHKYGLMQHVCEAFELVLADGRHVRCSKVHRTSFFHLINSKQEALLSVHCINNLAFLHLHCAVLGI